MNTIEVMDRAILVFIIFMSGWCIGVIWSSLKIYFGTKKRGRK